MFQYGIKINGMERKEAIRIVSETLDAPLHYLAAPSFAYEAGGWQISREGFLTSPPAESADELVTVLVALIGAGAAPGEFVHISFNAELSESQRATLQNLLKSKEHLIQSALGLQSTMTCTLSEANSVGFILLLDHVNARDAKAQIAFFGKLIEMAQRQSRALDAQRESVNDKYAMRCFLLRLGLIGRDSADTRKTLLARLNGNSAFRTEAALEAAKEKRRRVRENSIKNV